MTTRVPTSMQATPISVASYGAKGDGTTDDSAAFAAAIAAATADQEVLVPATSTNVYLLASPLVLAASTGGASAVTLSVSALGVSVTGATAPA